MAIKLVVTNPFKSYQVGDEITDPAKVAEFIDSHPAHIVKVAMADEPQASPSSASGTSTASPAIN